MSNNHNSIQNPNAEVFHRNLVKIGVVTCALGILLAGAGVMQRSNATAMLTELASNNAIPTVSVITPSLADDMGALVLPGNLEPLNSASIYAQTNGYIREWLVDIGDNVQKGQLLATLDAPELEHQLAQAKADYGIALAEQNNAHSMADRAKSLMDRNSGAISVEAVEQRTREAEAKAAAANAAKANVRRLEALQTFTRLTAPFDGVVTSRSAQLGDLVVAGNANAQPLFTVSDVGAMRVYVRVPQNYAPQMQAGQKASLVLPEYTGRQFDAEVTRSARAVDIESGSVLVELQANNSEGMLMPGAYVQVSFNLAASGERIRIPGSAILYRDQQPSIASIDENNIVTLMPVKIGRDEGTTVEIVAGITATDRVISTPPDAIRSGDEVRVVSAE